MSYPNYDHRPAAVPAAWGDLIEGLWLIATRGADRGNLNSISPLYCGHDELTVCADPAAFTPAELKHLAKLGFHAADECFTSTRFGSA